MAKSAPAIGPILVGYDASDDGVRALEYAATLAAATKATLRLVYVADDTVLNSAWAVVFDGSDLRATARRLLAEAVVTARSLGVAKKRVLTKVAFGSPVGVLTQLSQDCSMVVVGRRAHSGHARDFPGRPRSAWRVRCTAHSWSSRRRRRPTPRDRSGWRSRPAVPVSRAWSGCSATRCSPVSRSGC